MTWVFRTLSVMIVPLIGWGIKVQVEVSTLKSDMQECRRLEDKIEEVDKSTRSNSTAIAGMKEKFQNVENNISEIKVNVNSLISK